MKLKPYSAYKDSGVPWLGEIPVHWSILKTKRLFRLCIDKAPPNHGLDLLSIYTHIGVKPRRELEERGNKASSTDEYWIVKQGDIIVNKLLAWMGAVGVSHHNGVTSPAYDILRSIHPLNPEFYHYLFRTGMYLREFKSRSRGIMDMRLRLYFDQFGQIPLLYPSVAEQDSIVEFLNYYNRLVEHLLRAKQKLIALLNEQKQAIIHRAVTRGLNPNVRLKPSGVEWLGDVPEHWEVRRLGQISLSFCTGPFGSILHQSEYVEGGVPLINPTHMSRGRIVEDTRCSVPSATADRLSHYRLNKYDLIFSRRGELGRCALVRDREVGWLCGTGSIRVRVVYDGIEPEYLIQALQVRWVGEYLSLFSVGATMDSLNTGILEGVPILVPPVGEQQELLKRIAQEAYRIDRATTDALREISLLREYCTRLIADVVTGKLDVCKAAARLLGEIEESEPLDDVDMLSASGDEAEVADELEG